MADRRIRFSMEAHAAVHSAQVLVIHTRRVPCSTSMALMMFRKTKLIPVLLLVLGSLPVHAAEASATEKTVLVAAKKITALECAQAKNGCQYHVMPLPANLPAEWKGARWRVMISRPIYVNGYQLYAPGATSERWIDFDETGKVVDDFVPK
ncbi:MAG: hypothetical protein ACJ8GW_01545 [Massilia sp.]